MKYCLLAVVALLSAQVVSAAERVKFRFMVAYGGCCDQSIRYKPIELSVKEEEKFGGGGAYWTETVAVGEEKVPVKFTISIDKQPLDPSNPWVLRVDMKPIHSDEKLDYFEAGTWTSRVVYPSKCSFGEFDLSSTVRTRDDKTFYPSIRVRCPNLR